jgi:hypothetical protein
VLRQPPAASKDNAAEGNNDETKKKKIPSNSSKETININNNHKADTTFTLKQTKNLHTKAFSLF